MQKNLTIATVAFLCFIYCCGTACAQIDPRDSVILESKTVAPSTNPPDTATLMGVWITNKDTIGSLTVGIVERSLSGGAYMALAWPRTFAGAVSPLTTTLSSPATLKSNDYNGVSPDSFQVTGAYDTTNLATAEPPNLVRKRFWDIKFDTVSVVVPPGQVEFDSIKNEPYKVIFADLLGNRIDVNFVKSVFTITTSDVREIHRGIIPGQYALSQNYPNPFNASTQIIFALPKSGRTTLELFNLLGQKVGMLVDEYLSAGKKIVNWDGRDDKGMPVPSGVYFYQLRSGEFRETKKMLVLK